MGYLLTRKKILDATDLSIETLKVPEWNGSINITALTSQEKDRLALSLVSNPQNFHARLCAMAIVDDQGERIFSESDVILLSRKSAAVIGRIFKIAKRLSGFDKDLAALKGKG